MDQKHSMLYPQVDFNTPSVPICNIEQLQPNADALPMEAPPSYDVAIMAPSPAIPLPQSQPSQTPTVPTFVPGALNLGPNPCKLMCPACGQEMKTRMTHRANMRTHLAAALLCLVAWCCCACFVPYCLNSSRSGYHYCSKCNHFLGTYHQSKYK